MLGVDLEDKSAIFTNALAVLERRNRINELKNELSLYSHFHTLTFVVVG